MANIVVSICNPLVIHKGIYPYFETFLNGLKNAGNNVLCFEKIRHDLQLKEELPQKYKKQIQAFKPDLFVFYNNYFWDVTKHFDAPVVVFDVDFCGALCNLEDLKKSNQYKYFCITTDEQKILKETIGCKKEDILYVPPFTSVQTENIEQTTNIAFCGSHCLWTNDLYEMNNFLYQNPSKEEREIAANVFKMYLKSPEKGLDKIYEENYPHCKKRLKTNNDYTFSFRLSGIQRLRYLLAVEDLGLEIRGSLWDNDNYHILKAFPEIFFRYSNEIVKNVQTTQDFFNSAKIGFNTKQINAKSGFSWRVADILASNACLVSEKASDLKTLGFNVPEFESPAEARELCQKILANDNLRKDIVAHSQEIINKNHRFEKILPQIENFLDMKLHATQQGSLKFIRTDSKQKIMLPQLDRKKLTIKDKMFYNLSEYFFNKINQD